MPEEPKIKPFPSVFRMAWLMFMQPITFRREMQACGIPEPNKPAWGLWWGSDTYSSQLLGILVPRARRRAFVRRMTCVFCLIMFSCVILSAGLTELFRPEPAFAHFARSFAVAVGVGLLFGLLFSLLYGVAFGIVFGVFLSVAVVFGTIIIGTAFALGVASSVAFACSSFFLKISNYHLEDVAGFVFLCAAVGFTFGVLGGRVEGVGFGIALGTSLGVAFGIAFIFGYLRLLVCPLEFAVSLFLSVCTPGIALRRSPVFYHELSYVPLPFLEKQLLAAVGTDAALVRKCLKACHVAPGQRRIARRVEAELAVREMLSLIEQGRFAALAQLDGEWLPSGEQLPDLMVWVQEAARYLAAAQSASNAHTGLRQMERLISLPSNRPGADPDAKAEREWVAVVPRLVVALSNAGKKIEAMLEERASDFLPNPFQPNKALRPDLEAELFRGRANAVGVVERLLADPVGGASITLLAPRRTGKSTLLHMLPALVPDAIFVFCDIMEMPGQTVEGFLNHFAEALREAGLARRVVYLPRLERPATVEGFGRWVKALDEAAGKRRILFCIDEFERLEGLWPGTERDLLQFMGLLRATIQNRRHVRLLVSGAAPFDELGSIWRDHFINNRELRLGYFDEATTVELLRHPTPHFPSDAIPEPVAAAICHRTGGQPYLVHLYGHILVDRLNDAKRKQAELADLEPVEREVVRQATTYFGWMVMDCAEEPRRVFLKLAKAEAVTISPKHQLALERRGLLTPQGKMAVPVIARWVEENLVDEE